MDNIIPIIDQVEGNSRSLDNIVNEIIAPYCRDLDKYVCFIRDVLKDGEKQATNEELDDMCMNLSTLIYFASSMCERLGIRDDIGKAVYKEVYHNKRSSIEGGTVADKNSLAEMEAQNEQITSICYTRAYKIMKAKVESAQELLGSVKKVVSRRMQEYELTRLQR